MMDTEYITEISKFIVSDKPNEIELHFVAGDAYCDAYIPSSLGKQEREQIKTLIAEYEKQAEDATLRAADVRDFREYKRLSRHQKHEASRRAFPSLELHRTALYDSLRRIGWVAVGVDYQCLDTRFLEWNPETSEWNLHLVRAKFRR